MKHAIHISLYIFLATILSGQKSSWDFDGQVSLFSSYLPDAVYPLQTGGRYIPEISFLHQIDTTRRFDGEMSLNTYWSNNFKSFDDLSWDVDLNPYRIWLRYSEQQWEVRAGLQKIDFGAAYALRPLQWFNQIDPRDPLQITNGVYGILGRYYFLNNANIWIWGLYGNEKPRGLDFLESISTFPEFGARVQFPIPKGELGLSYHQRRADFSVVYPLPPIPKELQGPEYKMGLDIKMDVVIGLWLEASYTTLDEAVFDFRNQFVSTLGMDYTFGIGNGLNLIVEHMMFSFDDTAFEFEKPGHFTAGILSYPLGLNDNINSILYYNWEGKDLSFFINYQHSFPVVTAYLMAFYIPESQGGIQLSESFTAFSGPGVRLMFVYNH